MSVGPVTRHRPVTESEIPPGPPSRRSRPSPQAGRAPDARAVAQLVQRPASEGEMRARLDRFLASMAGPYQVDGETVHATPHFRMMGGYGPKLDEARRLIAKKLGPEASKQLAVAIARVTTGKATAGEIRRVVQALIDAGAHRAYPGIPKADAIRKMMWDYGVGLDCSGYCHQAFLATRASASGQPASPNAYGIGTLENHRLPSPGLGKVSPSEARAGDLFILAGDSKTGEPGHKTIVYSNREIVTHDRKLSVAGHVIPETFLRAAFPAGFPASVRAIVVDSSWGAGEHGSLGGGVKRELWVQNTATGAWGHWDKDGEFQISTKRGPYDHEIDGVYRGRAEP